MAGLQQIGMNILSAPGSVLKKRSFSMPSFNAQVVPQPIHKIRRSKQRHLDLDKQKQQFLPVISLRGMKNKQEEELNNKIKVITQRNLKKLQGRYQTIDRWKHRYIPDSSVLLLKIRAKGEQSSRIEQNELTEAGDSKLQSETKESPFSEKIFPMISRSPQLSQIPDKKSQRNKLQAELKARLERNKRYYQVQNQIEKEINYFQQCNQRVTPEKRRQLELKKIFANFDQKNRLNSICYQKINLHEHPENFYPASKHLRKRKQIIQGIQKGSAAVQAGDEYQSLIKRSKSIKQFRQRLMEQVSQAIPQGWGSPEVEDEELQQ